MSLRILAVFALLVPALSWACSDPGKHPEWAVFYAMVAANEPQPNSPVQLMYKIGDGLAEGHADEVLLSFWPFEEYDSGTWSITPSSGLEVDVSGDQVIEKGGATFTVRPRRPGFHYLTVSLRTTREGMETVLTTFLPVPADLDHSELRMGFAGKRLLGNRAFGHRSSTQTGRLQTSE